MCGFKEVMVTLKAKKHSEIIIDIPFDGADCPGSSVYIGITHSELMHDYTLRIEGVSRVDDYAREKGDECVEFPSHAVTLEGYADVLVSVSVNKDTYMISVMY